MLYICTNHILGFRCLGLCYIIIINLFALGLIGFRYLGLPIETNVPFRKGCDPNRGTFTILTVPWLLQVGFEGFYIQVLND